MNSFIKRKDSSCCGLIDQIFFAGIQAMSAMSEMVKYLHQKLKLQYVLPAKFTSNPLRVILIGTNKLKVETFLC